MAGVRRDSWLGALAPDDLAKVYETWRKFKGKWEDFAKWIVGEFEGAKLPSRTALYDSLRGPTKDCPSGGPVYKAWLAVRSAAIRSAGEQMAAWAKSAQIDNFTLVEGLKNLGCNALSAGDRETGLELLKDFRDTARLLIEEKEQDIKARAQRTKDAQLKLAREKFEAAEKRLNAVAAAVKSAKSKGGLTEETLKKIEEAAGLL